MIVLEDVVVVSTVPTPGRAGESRDSSGRTLLDRVSLTVERGEFVALTGASGTGKSTLLRAIVGLSPIESGSVVVNGSTLSARSVGTIRKEVAYVDQEPVLGADERPVREAIMRPFRLHANRHQQPNDDQLGEALRSVGLDESILAKTLNVISGGEKQRLSIVRASLLNRPVLLADEPTSALDANHRRTVADMLRHMADAALVATHDVDLISRATRVLRLGSGRLTEVDRDAAVKGESNHG